MEKKLKKVKIAITGGIGSGKSKALQIVGELGYTTFSCDEIYKSIIISANYIEIIKNTFPECIINNQIDRKKLAQIVFLDKMKREKLNSIAHPIIMHKLFKEIDDAPSELVFAEVPLLFEGKFEDNFDFVIVIQREKEKRIEGIKARDKVSHQEIEKRLQSQIDYDTEENLNYFKNKNYFLVKNNSKVEDLKKELIAIINLIQTTLS